MIYTNLGLSKLKVSKIGLGSLFQSQKNIVNKKFKSIINKSFDYGLNFIDTAPVYGDGRIEKLIGSCLRHKRKQFIIATKNMPSKNRYNELIGSANKSLLRLRTDYIDLYQIHWPNHKIEVEETVDALKHLIKEGKIRYASICNSNLNDLIKYKKLLKSNLISIQNEYNLFERSYEKNLKTFINKNNMALIAYSPLSNGKLFNGKKEKEVLDFLEKKYQRSKSELILNWITNQSKNIIAIPSTLKIKNLVKNINSQNFQLNSFDKDLIDKYCRTKIQLINTNNIIIKKSKKNLFSSFTDAIKNKKNLDPSPQDLAKELNKTNLLKPIKLEMIKRKKKYILLDGNLRYWSWVISKGNSKKIPSLVWKVNEKTKI